MSAKEEREKLSKAKSQLKEALALLPYLHEKGEDAFIRDEMLHAGLNPAAFFDHEVLDRLDIGGQELVLTRHRAYFRTYTGYEVSSAPYITDEKGEAVETSIYSMIAAHIKFLYENADKMDEAVEGNEEITNRDLIDSNAIVIKANMLYPSTAFGDYDKAVGFANEYMDFLIESQKKLLEAANAKPAEEDMAKEVGFNAETETREKIADAATA